MQNLGAVILTEDHTQILLGTIIVRTDHYHSNMTTISVNLVAKERIFTFETSGYDTHKIITKITGILQNKLRKNEYFKTVTMSTGNRCGLCSRRALQRRLSLVLNGWYRKTLGIICVRHSDYMPTAAGWNHRKASKTLYQYQETDIITNTKPWKQNKKLS
jgi:hypothetical protein